MMSLDREFTEKELDLPPMFAQRLQIDYDSCLDAEELEGVGNLALVEASETYDPERMRQFSSYAYSRVHNAIVDFIRKMRGRKGSTRAMARVDSLDDTTVIDAEGQSVGLADLLEDPVDVEMIAVNRDQLRCIVRTFDKLTPYQRAVAGHMLYNRTPKARDNNWDELAERLGKNPQTVQVVGVQTRQKIRRLVEIKP